jgi:ankyrin repeat protein
MGFGECVSNSNQELSELSDISNTIIYGVPNIKPQKISTASHRVMVHSSHSSQMPWDHHRLFKLLISSASSLSACQKPMGHLQHTSCRGWSACFGTSVAGLCILVNEI